MATFTYTAYNPPLDDPDYPAKFDLFFPQLGTDITSISNDTDANTQYISQISNTGLSFHDGVSVVFGNTSDTSITHTGTNTDIEHTGTGDLRLINTANIVAIGDTYVNLLDNIALNFGDTQDATIRYDLANTELDITSTNIHLTGAINVTGNTNIEGILSVSSFLDIASNAVASSIDSISGNMSIMSNGTAQIGYTSTAVNISYAGITKLATTTGGIFVAGSTSTTSLVINGTALTSTAAELNQLDGRTLASTDAVIDNFPSGTLMLFQQTAAPVGWVKQTTHNNKAFRVVSGTAASGGNIAFSTVFSRTSTDAHTLTVSQMPAHTHTSRVLHTSPPVNAGDSGNYVGDGTSAGNTGSSGSGGSHSHNMDIRLQYVDIIIASKTA